MNLEVQTFGCRLNTYESEVMRRNARAGGLDDALIVNTCAVTNEAVRQARQAIRRAARERPERPIIVAGCAAQLDPDGFAALPGVARVLGNAEKLEPAAFADPNDAAVRVNDIMQARDLAGHLVDGFAGRARAFVQVQQGCDHRCTFCIIPFARGPSRSVPVGPVIEQARRLVENGHREVVLTGVDITDYGRDLPGSPSLGGLVRRLLRAVPDLPRLRLSSLDACEIDAALLAAFAEEERLMPHLHLSLQSGDDLVLKRMRRRHNRRHAVALCARLRALRPEIVFGADLIAGFPTETEDQFANTEALVADCGLTHLHVFPYSARAGTPAARMPQVPMAVRKARAARLRAAGDAALARYLDGRVGRRERILVERADLAHTEGFAAAVPPADAAPGTIRPGTIQNVIVAARDGARLRTRAAIPRR